MVARIARLLFRIVGWLLTPLVITLAAALGATTLALVAPQFSTGRALIIMTVGGLLGAVLGFWGWMKLLERSRGLRDVLQVTTEGVPTEQGIDEVIGSDPADAPADDPPTTTPPAEEVAS
ncbi:MAG TPA: hypothetical protein VFN22_13265 [Gemmatimonadales bacterium]|nr:hypothetical protein [Gemmatimonadales bacterium]